MSRTVIIGGVAGGMSAATRLRRLDETAEIIVLERGEHVSFANCGLPYYLGGVIEERDALLPQTPAGLGRRFGLDVRVRHEAVAINPGRRTVSVRNLATGALAEEGYDTLILSPGAAPVRPSIPGLDPAALLSLRDIADTDALQAAITAAAPGSRAVVLGGGFIGVEMAENLRARGLDVTLVQRGGQILRALDIEMAGPVAAHLRAAGVDLRLNTTAIGYEDGRLLLSDGSRVEAALIVSAIGVRPETGLAAAAGLEIGVTGGIRVDSTGRTSHPHIYAVGDAAEKTDLILGEPRLIPLAGLANRHGRAVADRIAGLDAHQRGALATSIVEFRGLAAAAVGWNERELRERGIVPRIIHTHPASHAGYYPGAEPISLKLLVDPGNDRILGAQAVGRDGIDKRIDVLATAISAGVTASALADLELAYAPQFGSAKDPVNMLGYIAGNQALGADPTLQWHELAAALDTGATFLDVRGGAQLAEGLVPGSRHVPVEMLREVEPTLPPGPLIIHCRVGQGAHTAQRLLTQLGREVRNLDGGYVTWRAGVDALAAARPQTP